MAPLRRTTCWRANEVSLARDSFNAIVARQPLDVTEVMMRHSAMGRQAELGPSWCPSGLVSRQLTEALAAPKGKLPLRLREAQARANAEPGAQRDEWNATDQVSNILKPAQLVFASTKANRVKAAQAGATCRVVFERSLG
ncbi:unnamed protein product [Effrenium voratum]|nr:unnamed protein product [Effrenium voratum]